MKIISLSLLLLHVVYLSADPERIVEKTIHYMGVIYGRHLAELTDQYQDRLLKSRKTDKRLNFILNLNIKPKVQNKYLNVEGTFDYSINSIQDKLNTYKNNGQTIETGYLLVWYDKESVYAGVIHRKILTPYVVFISENMGLVTINLGEWLQFLLNNRYSFNLYKPVVYYDVFAAAYILEKFEEKKHNLFYDKKNYLDIINNLDDYLSDTRYISNSEFVLIFYKESFHDIFLSKNYENNYLNFKRYGTADLNNIFKSKCFEMIFTNKISR